MVEYPHQFAHIDIAFVGPDLDEGAQSSLNIVEVDVEDLLKLGGVFDAWRLFAAPICEAFGG